MIRNAEHPNARILIIDDNPLDSTLIAHTLRLAGYTSVTVINDPRLAADEYRKLPYDLVLLDLNMPHMDGFEVLDRLREADRDNYLPVLVMTAQSDRDVRLRVLEHGAKDYLTKPYDLQEVLNRINNMLEVRLLHNQVREQNRDLERAVGVRTHELMEANQRLLEEVEVRKRTEHDLEQARDKALEASKMKSQFLANVSHEVRTPLNGILGMLSLMINGPLTTDQDDHARTAMKSGETLLSLINDLLDFAKVESGRLELESIGYDLRQMVQDIVNLFEEQSTKKNLEVVTLISPRIPDCVIGDPARVRQVITNLIGNAIKFTERGEVVISLDLLAGDPEVSTIRFMIKDTGVGIKHTALNKIFDSFTQADGSTTRRFGGTGLGLAICKQLVELMGGTIHVESQENVGSTFWFILPQRINRGVALIDDVSARFREWRTIVLSDRPGSIESILNYLMAEEIKYELVPSVEELLNRLQQASVEKRPFQLVVLDHVTTPSVDVDLVKLISSESNFAGPRIMVLGSTGLRGEGRTARDAGVSAYLTMPVEHQEFRRCMMLMLADEGVNRLVTRHVIAEQAAQFTVRVLVVEDNPVNQKVAVKMLTRLGARVDVVVNGLEAVEAVAAGAYDLVLMDCLMPEMDGYDATRMIRVWEQGSKPPQHVPIIAMTANASDEDKKRCLEVGMDDFMAKPVTIEVVTRLLYKWGRSDRVRA